MHTAGGVSQKGYASQPFDLKPDDRPKKMMIAYGGNGGNNDHYSSSYARAIDGSCHGYEQTRFRLKPQTGDR
jgi:hypothetical protein